VITRAFQCLFSTRGLGLALLILAAHCQADSLRIVTWNLELSNADGAAGGRQIRPADAAAVLNPLAPDVILLQQVPNWQVCAELAEALKPGNYKILVCSAFRDARTATLGQHQVAILAKQHAYVSWSHPWAAQGETTIPGGFAFAAVRVRGQRLGFYSVQPGDESASLPQLLAQVASVRNWVTNQVQLFVVGGTLDAGRTDQGASPPQTLRLLQEAGFANVFAQASAIEQITPPASTGRMASMGDCLFTQPPGCATNPRILSNAVAGHSPVICDLEIDPAWIAAAWAERSAGSSARRTAPPGGTNDPLRRQPAASQALAQPSILTPQLIATLGFGTVIALMAVVWALARRKRGSSPGTPKLLPVGADSDPGIPSSYTVVVGTQSGTGPSSPAMSAPLPPRPIIHVEAPGTTHTEAQMLRRRALAAEERADRATAALRTGLLHHMSRWLKQKLVRKLFADRAQLLEAQRAATERVMTVEERLARIELQIQQQNQGYQNRIEVLTRELLAAKDENRDLIRAQIRQVKAEMEAARARLRAQAEREA
jgi:hypothetical protein